MQLQLIKVQDVNAEHPRHHVTQATLPEISETFIWTPPALLKNGPEKYGDPGSRAWKAGHMQLGRSAFHTKISGAQSWDMSRTAERTAVASQSLRVTHKSSVTSLMSRTLLLHRCLETRNQWPQGQRTRTLLLTKRRSPTRTILGLSTSTSASIPTTVNVSVIRWTLVDSNAKGDTCALLPDLLLREWFHGCQIGHPWQNINRHHTQPSLSYSKQEVKIGEGINWNPDRCCLVHINLLFLAIPLPLYRGYLPWCLDSIDWDPLASPKSQRLERQNSYPHDRWSPHLPHSPL